MARPMATTNTTKATHGAMAAIVSRAMAATATMGTANATARRSTTISAAAVATATTAAAGATAIRAMATAEGTAIRGSTTAMEGTANAIRAGTAAAGMDRVAVGVRWPVTARAARWA